MKKIIYILLTIIIFYFVIQKVVIEWKKNNLREAISHHRMIYDSQTSFKMAEEGNVKYFINKKELNEPIAYFDILKRSSIHNAVKFKQYEVVKFFIENKYKFNYKNDEGMLPLGVAAKNCDYRMIELLKPVSNLDLKDEHGKKWQDYYKECKK